MQRGQKPRTSERVPELMKALGEPRRIAIVCLVQTRELSAGEIAKHFQTTRQAVSQHLQVMTDAGLLDVRRQGTRRLYRARRAPFGELLNFLRPFWEDHVISAPAAAEANVSGEYCPPG
jgi:DNA-binding transcriptional ArsR family regulator